MPEAVAVKKNQPDFVKKSCADLVVFAARGSGQSARFNSGAGQELYRSIRSMSRLLHKTSNTTVRIESIDYQSDIDVNYYASVADGRGKLHRQFEKRVKGCADSQFAFFGFSKGAQVVHEYAFDLPKARAKRVAFVAMLSDPRNNIDDAIERWSYTDEATTQSGKLGAGERFQDGVRDKAISLCYGQDEICNWPRSGGPTQLSDTHKHFYQKPATYRSTAKALVAMIQRDALG